MAEAADKTDLSRFAAVLANKPAQATDVVDWVFNHLHCDISSLADDEPPSMGALAMLLWANRKTDTFMQAYLKIAGTRATQADKQQELRDDGRVLRILDDMEREFYAAHSAA